MSYRNDAARVGGVNEPVWWINEIGVLTSGQADQVERAAWCAFERLRRTKLLGANKCETGSK